MYPSQKIENSSENEKVVSNSWSAKKVPWQIIEDEDNVWCWIALAPIGSERWFSHYISDASIVVCLVASVYI